MTGKYKLLGKVDGGGECQPVADSVVLIILGDRKESPLSELCTLNCLLAFLTTLPRYNLQTFPFTQVKYTIPAERS